METEPNSRPPRAPRPQRPQRPPHLRLEPPSHPEAPAGFLRRGVFATPYLGPNLRPNYISITSDRTKLEERELPVGLSVPELKLEMEQLLDELNPQPGRNLRAV